MDFEWTAEERTARDGVVAWLDAERAAGRAEPPGIDPARLREDLLRRQCALARLGYWKVGLGPGDDARTVARLAMDLELARASASTFVALQATRHVAGLLAGWGTEPLREGLLGALTAGETIGAIVLPEAGGAADGTPTATLEANGSWTLRGKRPFVASAPLADLFAIFAEAGGKPLVALVPRGRAGLKIGGRLALIGLDALATAPLELDGVRVSAVEVLGPFDGSEAEHWLRRSRDLGLAAACVGRMQRALAAAKAHAESHVRSGKPVVARQEVGFRLAELLMLAQTAELLVLRAAWLVATGARDADTVVRCAKVFGAENAERVAGGAMQILAGPGCVSGNEAERAWREARTLAVLGTTTEISRMAIADDLLARV
jgi:alkylation response protein AidB-like acyl-CoA dehydrogenase